MKGECSEKPCPRAPGSPGGDSGEEITPVWPGLACAWHSTPGTAVPSHQLPHQMWPLVAFHNSLVL